MLLFALPVTPAKAGVVRLKASLAGEMKALIRKDAIWPVAESNCVAKRRGEEQLKANDPSVG